MSKSRVLPLVAGVVSVFIGFLGSGSDIFLARVAAAASSPPVISLVGISDVTVSAATISWSTDVPADSQVEYGTTVLYESRSALDPALVTKHKQTLTGLTAGTKYHFRVMSRNAEGSLAISLWDYTFKTADPADSVPPVISGVAVGDVTKTSATLYWKTNELSDSQVAYGLTAQYGRLSARDLTKVTLHSVTLDNLSAGTTYHYQIMSRDAAGNLGTSPDLTLTTLGNPPVISNVAVSGISSVGATISWATNVPADGQVAYGTTEDCPLSTVPDATLAQSHVLQLDGLTSETTYYFRVRSKDAAGQLTVGSLGSFQTAAPPPFELVIPRLVTRAGQNPGGTDDSMYTGIAVANLGSQETAVTFSAYDAAGALIAGADVVNPAKRVLPPGSQLAVTDVGLFGAGLPAAKPVGWINVSSRSDSVTGMTAVFNGSVSILDGAPMVTVPLTSFVFPEIDDHGLTSLHIANSNSTETSVSLLLIDADGAVKAEAYRTIPPLGALAESAASLFPDVSPAGADSIVTFSDLGVAAYELLGAAPRDVAGLNGLNWNGGASTLYCPQYVVNGDYRTTLSIVEVGGIDGSVVLRLVGDDGVQIGTVQTVRLAPYGKLLVSDPSLFGLDAGARVSGYVEVESSGANIVGSVVFEDVARASFRTALPLVSQLQDSIVFSQVASDNSYFTGLTLLNPGASEVTATVDLHLSDGSLQGSAQVVIPARNRISRLLTQLLPGVGAQSSGYIRIAVTGGIAGFSVFGTYDLKTLSAVPAQVAP